jgi:hypothetical protein
VVRNRQEDYQADAVRREALADIARKHARAVQESLPDS